MPNPQTTTSSDESGVSGIRPPKNLVLNNENMTSIWKNWIQQFEWYAIATQLAKKPKEVQAASFMAIIGPDAIQIFNTFNLTSEQQKEINIIKQKFQEYFIPKSNISFERYQFFKIVQQEDETFDEFLTKIKTQVKNCEFENLQDSLLKDKIVFGVKSDVVREKLLNEDNLDLQKAIVICRSSEQTSKQLKEIQKPESSQVDFVKHRPNKSNDESFKCKRCDTTHQRKKCPAFGKKCEICNTKGHFSTQCWSKNKNSSNNKKKISFVNDETEEDLEEDEILYIRTLTKNDEEDWNEIIETNNKRFQVKLDTGAQCNVLPEHIVKQINAEINPSGTKRLISFTEDRISVIGESKIRCKVKNQDADIIFKIVKEKVSPILGRKTCQELGLIARLHEIKNYNPDEVFKGLGCHKKYVYDIDLIDNPKFNIHPPRRIPYSIRGEVKQELDNMVKLGVIKPVKEPTPAVSPMVIVRQKGKIRICLDPTDLNKNILRRHYPLKTLEEIAAQINGAKYFTLLDCRRGFWQIPVTQRTQKYLTFSTPWGRFSCTRIPFGICSAPEVFQEVMCSVLKGIPNTQCSMDDILIHAKSKDELKKVTKRVIDAINKAGLKLNKEKCIFEAKKIGFLGHILSEKGVSIDPHKVEAINNLKTPTNRTELQRLLGMVTYLNKFIPNLSELTDPLRKLLKKDIEFNWDHEQNEAFNKIKQHLVSPPLLKFYDVNQDVTLSVDASSKSLGAALLQGGQPIAYATKALTESQVNWPQIEKEAFAIRFGCQKFHEYIYGKKLTIESDHKPLESIFTKPLQSAPARLQRIIFDVLQYAPRVIYRKGKNIPLADILSRDCTHSCSSTEEKDELEVQIILTVSSKVKHELIQATREDEELEKLKTFIHNGFPDILKNISPGLKHYSCFQDELAEYEGIIFKGEKIVVPKSLIPKMLTNIHRGHLGIRSCLNRARQLLYWRGMNTDIENFIKKCRVCEASQRANYKETVCLKKIPDLPWQIVSSDIFTCKGKHYLNIYDSYSGFVDFKLLKTLTSIETINHLKNWFSVHGIPQIFETDNGPQYSSREFKEFSTQWSFQHSTSSPYHPRGNGLAERGVQISKNILKKCQLDNSDIHLALMNYRNTPRNNLGSPNQRLFARATRTIIPIAENLLKPKIIENVPEELKRQREKQKVYADYHAREPPKLENGDKVRIQVDHRQWKGAEVIRQGDNERQMIVKSTDGQIYRRNTSQLHKTEADFSHENKESVSHQQNSTESSLEETNVISPSSNENFPGGSSVVQPQQIITRSGRIVKPVKPFNL